MALRCYFTGGIESEVLDPEEISDHIALNDAHTNGGQNNTKDVGVGSQDIELRTESKETNCRFPSKIPKLITTKTTNVTWEMEHRSTNKKLEDRQTRLEAQLKALQDQIDSACNGRSLSNWLDEQANKK